MKTDIRLPVELMVGTWSTNVATNDQLKQLPDYAADRAREISSGTILKYVIAAIGSGLQYNNSRWTIRCRIPEIKKALGESGSDYSTPRAALVVSQNLLFRPLNESRPITQERFIIGVTTDPEKTGSTSEVILELSPKYAALIKNPKPYTAISLEELGRLRESGNIFVYLCFARYSGINIRFEKDELAKLTAKPNQSYKERLAYYDNYSQSRRWSLIRRDLQTKVNNIHKHTSLRIEIGKPDKKSVILTIRTDNTSRPSITGEFSRLVANICKITGATHIGVQKRLEKTFIEKGTAFIDERLRFIMKSVSFSSDYEGGKLNGRRVGIGLMLNFMAGQDSAFVEFSPSREPVLSKKAVVKKKESNSSINTDTHKLIERLGEEKYEKLLMEYISDPQKRTNKLVRKMAEQHLLADIASKKIITEFETDE